METTSQPPIPSVPLWRINSLRFLFFLMAAVMGTVVWQQLIFESVDWPVARGLSKSMLGALALVSLLGVRYPLKMLPLMLYELVWKTVWLLVIALPAWLGDRWTNDIELLFFDCIGIVIAYFVMPWRYVWHRYFLHPGEAWRRSK